MPEPTADAVTRTIETIVGTTLGLVWSALGRAPGVVRVLLGLLMLALGAALWVLNDIMQASVREPGAIRTVPTRRRQKRAR